jgi:hypothetical protein
MVKRGLVKRSACAAGLLAVALLSFAFAQSVVMRATGSMPAGMTMAICTSAGTAHATVGHDVPGNKPQKACPYCAAAAHAPVCGTVASVSRSVAVAWTTYAALQPLGPRGPPEFTPSARGPPPAALTI